MGEMVVQALRDAGANFLQTVSAFLPRAAVTVSIVLAGWIIAFALKHLTRAILRRLRFDALCERQGVGELLRKADLPPADVLLSAIVFWVVWVGFLLSGVDVLGFAALQGIVAEFAVFVPRLVVALGILGIGFVLANVAWRATLLAAVNAKVPSPRMLSGIVRGLLWMLTVAMALDHVGVARTIVLTAFAIAFGAVMLGLAIAFGIGGGRVAKRLLDHWFPERAATPPDDVTHL